MKKSYDYIKTLKTLTSGLSVIFSKCISGNEYDSEKIAFGGTKTELTNNLINEFITPIDRGDIFILSECLSSQLNSINNLKEISCFIDNEYSKIAGMLSDCFFRQEDIFSRFEGSKNTVQLCDGCRGAQLYLVSVNTQIYRSVKNCVLGNDSKPLLRYYVYAGFLELSKCLQRTFTETERVLINNS